LPSAGGAGREPVWLREADMLAIHARQIERYGGAHGVLDRNIVLPALARPVQVFTYDERADIPRLAAAYLAGFARSQGFRDGNKRTGLACALVFLELNGWELDAPPEDLYAMTMAVANAQAGDEAVAEFFGSYARQIPE
jgi:death-on-curing protein